MSANSRPDTTGPGWSSVVDGRRGIGHLLSRGKEGVDAFDINTKSLGIFRTTNAAAIAVAIEHERGGAAA
jgi:hypothetical protein